MIILSKKRILVSVIAVHSQKDENQLAEIGGVLPKRKQPILLTNMIPNITANTYTAAPDHLDKLLCHLQCFFFKDQRKKDGSIFEPFTMSSFPKTLASCALASEYLQCY